MGGILHLGGRVPHLGGYFTSRGRYLTLKKGTSHGGYLTSGGGVLPNVEGVPYLWGVLHLGGILFVERDYLTCEGKGVRYFSWGKVRHRVGTSPAGVRGAYIQWGVCHRGGASPAGWGYITYTERSALFKTD